MSRPFSDIIKSIDDRYSDRARPMTGYHDSVRTITFVEGSKEEDQQAEMEEIYLELKKHNMWTYAPKKLRENVWSIDYGYDSGD